MSVARGRMLGAWSRHFSIDAQTPSDSPRMSRFIGRGGRSPARTRAGAAWEGIRENGCSSVKTYGIDLSGLIC